MERRPRYLGFTAAALALALTACANDEDKDDAPAAAGTSAAATSAATSAAATSAAASSAAAAASSAPAAAGAAKLAVAKSDKLGDVVVDAQGFTLYRFDNDTNAPSKSNCTGGCISTWPPALTTGKPDAAGVDTAAVGTLKLADGTEQITLDGWPLYRYAADTKAGDANGQGVGGIWWAVTAKGEKATAAAAAKDPYGS